jgi:hypothetical protein
MNVVRIPHPEEWVNDDVQYVLDAVQGFSMDLETALGELDDISRQTQGMVAHAYVDLAQREIQEWWEEAA